MGCCSGSKPIEVKDNTPQPRREVIEPVEDIVMIESVHHDEIEIPSAHTEASVKMLQSKDLSPVHVHYKPVKKEKKAIETLYSKVKVKCDTYETMGYIWVHKDESLKFRVEGTWTPDPSCPQCDSKGFPTYTMEDFNYGALVGRIPGEKYFNIVDFSVYTSPIEGPLLMKMFSPRFHLKSSGELTVYIYGGTKISKEEMNKRLGWNTALIYANLSKFSLSIIEEELLVDFNKMRLNPRLYNKLYIGVDRVLTASFLNKQGEDLRCLNICWKLMYLLKDYWDIFNKQKRSGKMTHEKQIALFLGEREVENCKIITQQYEERNPHKISMKMIQNAQMKEILFNQEYHDVGIKVIIVNNTQVIVCVVFGDMREYVYRAGAY